ncbi:MAG: glycosyltransferase family 2 protein [Deltaproteobacteria bacterium]|nr:glycosyltransferase family 2 protein [Deltaproteobacteria bacterium]
MSSGQGVSIQGAVAANRIDELEQLLGVPACRALGIYRVPDDFVLSVVIPVYNEVDTVEQVIEHVRSIPLNLEIIVVDDGSTDGTVEILKGLENDPGLRIFFSEVNQGKGAALKIGFEKATGAAVIVQDADLEYDPGDYLKLLQPIVDGQADVVFGSRFAGERHRVLYFWHYLGNRFLTLLSNAFTNLNLTDMETGYKLFRREVIQQIAPTLEESRFGIEPELTAKVARLQGVRIFELPISYSGRTYQEGKKITWRDGMSALRCILKYGLRK